MDLLEARRGKVDVEEYYGWERSILPANSKSGSLVA